MPTEKPFNSEISRPVVIHPQAKTKPKVLVLGAGPAGLTGSMELICRDYDVTVLEQDPTYVGGINAAPCAIKTTASILVGTVSFPESKGGGLVVSDDGPGLSHPSAPEPLAVPRKILRLPHQNRRDPAQIRLGLCCPNRCRPGMAQVRPGKTRRQPRSLVPQPLWRLFWPSPSSSATTKALGLPCKLLSTDFAGQRIKGVSIWNTITSALRSGKKNQVKSFIDQFNYPRQGPGELWERVASKIQARGGQVLLDRKVVRLEHDGKKITQVIAQTSSERKVTQQIGCSQQSPTVNLLNKYIHPWSASIGSSRLVEIP